VWGLGGSCSLEKNGSAGGISVAGMFWVQFGRKKTPKWDEIQGCKTPYINKYDQSKPKFQ
jgi:hypothetical protein